jgi:adenylylsulfate kinase-like enzyme
MLKSKGIVPVVPEGDEIRNAIPLNRFDQKSRKKYNLSIGCMASLFEEQEHFVIVAGIAPYAAIRNKIRTLCKHFIEVYVSTDISVCIERDPKGLYARSMKGEIKEFTGISAPYFPPVNPEVIIDTATLTVQDCVDKIITALIKGK